MRRRTLDALLATGGLVVAAILLIAGGLLTWGQHFADNHVRTELSAQKIFFPPAGSAALKPTAEIGRYLNQYAGQQLTTGAQAQAYADHFIAVHLQEIGGGKTYSELSTQAQANPTDAALQGKVQTMFRGETLRGLLLNAYAFGKVGEIAGIAAIVSFAGAGVLLVLSLLGFAHGRRVGPDVEVLPNLGAHTPAPIEH